MRMIVSQDNSVELEDEVPVLNVSSEQAAQMAMQTFIPFNVIGDRSYLLSLRHGKLADRNALLRILSGTFLKDVQN